MVRQRLRVRRTSSLALSRTSMSSPMAAVMSATIL